MEDKPSFRVNWASRYAVLFIGMFAAAGVLWLLQQRTVVVPYRVGNEVLQLEVTQTAKGRVRGLSGRDSIGKAEGMFFVFPERDRHGIWMKDMRFAIDILWVADGKIVDIAPRVQPPAVDAPDEDLPIYYPRLEADWVIEVPAGVAEIGGWKIEDSVVAL